MAALRHQTGSSPPRRTELVCTRGAVCDALIAGTLLASSQKVQDLLQDIDSKRRIRDSGMPSAQRIGWQPPLRGGRRDCRGKARGCGRPAHDELRLEEQLLARDQAPGDLGQKLA